MLPMYLVILTFGVLVISAPTDKMETASGARTATETTVMNEPITDASWSSLTKSTDDDSGANCPSLSGSDMLIAAALGLVFGIAALSCLYLVKNRIGACTNSICFDGSSDFVRRSNSELPPGQNIIYASVNVKPARTQRDTSGDGEDANEDSPGDPVSTRGQFGEEQEKVLGRQDIVYAWLNAKPKRRQSESSEADGEIH